MGEEFGFEETAALFKQIHMKHLVLIRKFLDTKRPEHAHGEAEKLANNEEMGLTAEDIINLAKNLTEQELIDNKDI